MEERLNDTILKVCMKIAKRGEGAMIILGNAPNKPLIKQQVEEFDIIENPKLLESLALMDGAVIINNKGKMKFYGTMIKVKTLSMLRNLGTRHNSAMSASMEEGNKVYVVSEEDNKIRIFQGGKMILEIDGREKDIEKRIPEINKLIESIGWGTTGAIGIGTIVPIVGISPISGITIFATVTGVAYLLKKLKDWGIIK